MSAVPAPSTSRHAASVRYAGLPRKRGRPPGLQMQVAAEQLRHHHLSFVRAALEGVTLRKAWQLYLAFEGGPDDERHFAARLRELARLIRLAADQRGLGQRAAVALAGLEPKAARNAAAQPAPLVNPPCPAVQSIDTWIPQRPGELAGDIASPTRGGGLTRYRAEFAVERSPARVAEATCVARADRSSTATQAPSPALAGAAAAPLRERLAALNELNAALAKRPELRDGIGAWLSADLARRLAATAVAGKPMPLLTLGNLIAFVNLYHHRWWVHVPRLGATRAQRLVAWLEPVAAALGQPLRETALKPLQRLKLARQDALARLAPDSHLRFGIVPLDRLSVPLEMDGRRGVFRSDKPNTLGVHTDLEAIFAWLRRHQDSPRTHASYSRIVERFYLWCLLVKRKPMSSLDEGDYLRYRQFLAKPAVEWVQARRVGREASEWRPFKGALSAPSARLNLTVISSMLTALIEAGYLTANAARGVLPSMKLPHLRIDIDRSFDEAQWHWLMQCWREEYAPVGPRRGRSQEQPLLPDPDHPDQVPSRAAALRRTRLILELGATTGLRLIEFVTTRRGAITREVVDGESVWIMKVLGKGNKLREVLLFDDIKALIDQHHRDMEAAGTSFDPANEHWRELRQRGSSASTNGSPEQAESRADPPDPALVSASASGGEHDASGLPLIGALRTAPPRWKTNPLGVAGLDRSGPRNADRCGSLDPTALYQSLKRFLRRCSSKAKEAGADIDHVRLASASTHWLRHFFANSAIADKIDVSAVRDAMGHASVATTSIYLRTERTRMVNELSRMRRRGK